MAACTSAPYLPNDRTAGEISVEQARGMLVAAVGRNRHSGMGMRFTTNKVSITEDGKVVAPATIRIPALSDIATISAYDRSIWSTGADGKSLRLILIYGDDADTLRAANALYVLKQNAIKANKEADVYQTAFAASLAEHRKTVAANSPLPEEANKYKVQAEGAVRDKAFDDAADYYAEALKIAPWWPAGHYNRSLILAEIGDYESAQQEMKRYLQLVPDASNVLAAQDKIYEWERKAK